MERVPCKLVVVGSGNVGKTSMLFTYGWGHFPKEYMPYVFDMSEITFTLDGNTIDLSLWDTCGSEDYDRLRPLSYPETNIFLVLFSVISQNSFDEISSKWIPEIRHHCPDTPFILVGTKTDLRENLSSLAEKGILPIERVQGENLALEVGALQYNEISALQHPESVKDLLHQAVHSFIASKHYKRVKGGCLLL
eukprot:TRINITY_DN9959_c0_g3_i1.p1 TRINITY_DN9959_c0_g3~~TRINITY_DN9959_c0_g3_i1.p1  ORF type:complete len:193 (-),score=43.16 TRINITY_DN9959_c0_g3_i1:64-642(-)